MLSRLGSLLALVAAATAFTTPKTTPAVKTDAAKNVGVAQKAFAAAAASASLVSVLIGGPLEAGATSKTAGQISLNSIPPTSVKVDVRDLPVIGDVLSGTYTRVSDASDKSPASVSSQGQGRRHQGRGHRRSSRVRRRRPHRDAPRHRRGRRAHGESVLAAHSQAPLQEWRVFRAKGRREGERLELSHKLGRWEGLLLQLQDG